MGHRGKERQIICAGCKRYCRRDKAVYIEKVVFSNPIDRKDIAEKEGYQAVFKREVAYCPGCGKHLRIYEKKIQENQRNKERLMERQARQPRPAYDSMHSRSGGYKETQTQAPTISIPPQEAAQAEETEEPTTTQNEDTKQAA